ncbi:MAG: hypothetical protein ACE5HN_00925 [Nitrospiria bacterium]
MTVAVCTNCGELKHGAWCTCPNCESEGLDGEVSILLSDHSLSEDELRRIGDAIHVIHDTGLDEEMRFHLLTYYLSRKWPKLLEYEIDALKPQLQRKLDTLYRSELAHFPGQEEPDLKVSPTRQHTWTTAMGATFQEEDDAWQAEVNGILLNGMDMAKQIVSLQIEAGEGAVLQRLTHNIRTLLQGGDYRRLVGRSAALVGDAREYQRTVNTFCSRVKNGWSDRTEEQATYFRGLCQRLVKMADCSKTIIEHKADINLLIDIDFKRVRQEFSQSYKIFIDFSYVVLDPSRINPGGTYRSG